MDLDDDELKSTRELNGADRNYKEEKKSKEEKEKKTND